MLHRSSSRRPKASGHCRQPRYGWPVGLASGIFSSRGRARMAAAREWKSSTTSSGTPWLTTCTMPRSSPACRRASSWPESPASRAAKSTTVGRVTVSVTGSASVVVRSGKGKGGRSGRGPVGNVPQGAGQGLGPGGLELGGANVQGGDPGGGPEAEQPVDVGVADGAPDRPDHLDPGPGRPELLLLGAAGVRQTVDQDQHGQVATDPGQGGEGGQAAVADAGQHAGAGREAPQRFAQHHPGLPG